VQNSNEKKVVELNIGDVLPNRFQPRIKFDEESINELAMSIKKYGVIQPIVVRQIGDKYEIIAGERRYKASVIAGKNTIPAIVYELSDKDSVEIALLENVQREDLTPIEKAISYKKILDMGYINQEALAEKIGKSQSSIANTLRLLNLTEEVQEALLETKISERHARSLLKIKNEKQQVNMLNRIINERLTVRKTDEEIEKMLNNETNENVVSIPDIQEPVSNNYDLPGFMNIDRIENEAQDIIKEEKPVADLSSLLTPSPIMVENSGDYSEDEILKPGKFFNLFDDDKENKAMEDLLSGNTTTNVTSEVSAMPEFNFEVPSVETPAVEPVMPEFNFEVPSVETPAVEPVMPEFNFELPSVETPTVEPAMPEFNFEVPSVETPSVERAMPEFNFEVPSVETPAVEPVMPEFNFEVPSVETPAVEPVMPEFNFEVPSVETPTVEPVMPEFNFEVPSVETPAVEPVMPEFNFEVPSVETPTVEPVMPEFNFEVPSVETPAVEPVMPEPPVVEQPKVEEPEEDNKESHRGGLFGLFGKNKKKEEPENKKEIEPTVEPQDNFEIPVDFNNNEIPTLNDNLDSSIEENTITVPNNIATNIRLAIDTIRNCETNLQNMGFTVEIEEIDFENIYQVVFKINK